MEQLRIGVAGLGFIGPQHIDGLRRVPGVVVAAVCDRDEGSLRAVQERFGIEKAYADWRQLAEDPDIDVVHNCTPNAVHDEVNRAALENGKHVYCEKPLSQSAAEARAVWKLAVARGLAHGLNQQYRLNAPVQEMRARLQKGLAGRPLMVYGHYLQESGARSTDWAPRMGNTGIARTVNDIGIHWADTACCVMGQPIVAVMANFVTHHPVRIDAAGGAHPMDTEDTAFILVRFADGTPGTLLASKAAMGHKNDLRVCVSCDGYGMEWAQEEPDRLTVGVKDVGFETVYMNPRTCQPEVKPYITTPMGHVMGWPDALHSALEQFYASIRTGGYRNGPQPYATFEDGFRGMAFVEACVRSHQTRAWAEVEQI